MAQEGSSSLPPDKRITKLAGSAQEQNPPRDNSQEKAAGNVSISRNEVAQYVLGKNPQFENVLNDLRSSQRLPKDQVEFVLATVRYLQSRVGKDGSLVLDESTQKALANMGYSDSEVKKYFGNPDLPQQPERIAATLTEEEIKQLSWEAYQKEKAGEGFALMVAVGAIPPEVGGTFNAHRIAKGYREADGGAHVGTEAQLRALQNLLTNGIDRSRGGIENAQLVTPGGRPDVANMGDAPFVLLSEPGKSLNTDGIKYVLVNETYSHALGRLQAAFPNVQFIRAEDAGTRLKQIKESSESKT